jgi:hypothetical protein
MGDGSGDGVGALEGRRAAARSGCSVATRPMIRQLPSARELGRREGALASASQGRWPSPRKMDLEEGGRGGLPEGLPPGR